MIIRRILFLAGAVAGAFAGELRLLLVDESGQPFAGARTTVVFTTPELGAEQVRSGVSDPAGVCVARGTAIGVYNTAQTLGLFCGGLGGGWIAGRYGAGTLFGACTALTVVWLGAAAGMRAPGRARTVDASRQPG